MNKAITLILFALVLSAAQAQNLTTSELEKAETYFRNSSVVTFNEDYSPNDYIGSLIYYRPGSNHAFQILKIKKPFDSTVVKTVIDEILYQKMHTREEVASVKFLGIFNTKMTNENLLEVILLRDYSLETPHMVTDPNLFGR